MQAKTDAKAAETASLLESFGIELSAGGLVVMTDFAKAERAYIHHTSGPVAVVAMAVASPTFARGRFPTLRLVNVVTKVPAMDRREMRALAMVCGANVDSSSRASAFAAHLLDVIARLSSTPSSRACQTGPSMASTFVRVEWITARMRWMPLRWPSGAAPTRRCRQCGR